MMRMQMRWMSRTGSPSRRPRAQHAVGGAASSRAVACAEILGWLYEYTAALPPEPAQVRVAGALRRACAQAGGCCRRR